MRFSELTCKEVVCITDGSRLGYVTDLEFDHCGTITAIVVPCRCKLLSFGGPQQDYVIPFCCIKRIGGDIILVDVSLKDCTVARQKNLLFR